jgi:hypothetical protein
VDPGQHLNQYDPLVNSSCGSWILIPCFLISDDAAAGPGTLGSTAAAAAVAGQEGQAGPVPATQDVRAGLREGYNILFIFFYKINFSFCFHKLQLRTAGMDCCKPV